MKDSDYMRMALELAKRGQGWTAPNPMVGAVIVKSGRVIGQGYHRRCGGLHAERGGPCLLRESRRAPLVCDAGTLLPRWKAAALHGCDFGGWNFKSRSRLRRPGIPWWGEGLVHPAPARCGSGDRGGEAGMRRAEPGVLPLHEDPAALRGHEVRHDVGRQDRYPYRSIPVDYREEARRRVHQDRHRYSAIMTGVGTVLADNPR